MPPKRVNMRDVAAKAGVTPTTVSLALRNDQRISEPTRKKVLEAAEALNYRPNPMVSALMSQVQSNKRVENSTKLALLAPYGNYKDSDESPFRYAREVIKAMRERAEELGYSGIDVFEPEEDIDDLNQVARVIRYRGIKGILLPPFMRDYVNRKFDLDLTDFAVVAAGYSQQIRGIHRVAHDQYRIAFESTQNILNLGYRRIGITLSKEYEKRTGWHYTGGFFGAVQQHSKAWHSRKSVFYRDRYYQYGLDQAPLHEALIEWIKKNKIECLITQDASDIDPILKAGIKIPEDIGISIISIAEARNLAVGDPCGMFHDPNEIGRAAVDLVTAQVARNEYGRPPFPKTVLTRPKWNNGDTLRDVKSGR